jgi:hypothetical protein
MASYTTDHPYSSTALNGSSISLVVSAHSHTSSSNDMEPAQNSHLYKPVRPTISRLRPALPTSFLQIPSSDSTSQPWKLRTQSSSESLRSRSTTPRDQVLLRELADSVQYSSDSSSFKSNSPGTEAGLSAKVQDMNRFSTCFGDGSSVSLLDPHMMQIDERRKRSVLHEKTRCISLNSGDSGCYLTDLKLSISESRASCPHLHLDPLLGPLTSAQHQLALSTELTVIEVFKMTIWKFYTFAYPSKRDQASSPSTIVASAVSAQVPHRTCLNARI